MYKKIEIKTFIIIHIRPRREKLQIYSLIANQINIIAQTCTSMYGLHAHNAKWHYFYQVVLYLERENKQAKI